MTEQEEILLPDLTHYDTYKLIFTYATAIWTHSEGKAMADSLHENAKETKPLTTKVSQFGTRLLDELTNKKLRQEPFLVQMRIALLNVLLNNKQVFNNVNLKELSIPLTDNRRYMLKKYADTKNSHFTQAIKPNAEACLEKMELIASKQSKTEKNPVISAKPSGQRKRKPKQLEA